MYNKWEWRRRLRNYSWRDNKKWDSGDIDKLTEIEEKSG